MRRWCRAAARVACGVVCSLPIAGAPLGAQVISLAISGLLADSMPPAPQMTVTALQTLPELGPYSVTLELSTEQQFQRPFYNNAADGENGTFTIDSLLSEHETIFFRARLIDHGGVIRAEARSIHPVRGWLRLVNPPQQSLALLDTRKPQFVWSSPPITVPPGLWVYDLSVITKETGQVAFFAPGLGDTSFVFPDSLEANASYRWQVHARAANNRGNGEITVQSAGSIVIGSPDKPTFSLFYPNFPNPFGRGQLSALTCFWFDLAQATTVRLTIYDIRLREVRHMIPGPFGDGRLGVGAWGRQPGAQSGCDPLLQWDGRDDNGRFVPAGVYIAVLTGTGLPRHTVKIMFKGP